MTNKWSLKVKEMQLTNFKKIIQSQKEETILLIKNNDLEIDSSGDDIDGIQARILARTAAQLVIRHREKLAKLNIALKKIDDGTFGSCEECDEPIGDKRLIFNPSFNTCISCAEELDLLKKRNK